MNANAIIKSFLFMMCTSNAGAKSEGPRDKVPALRCLHFALHLLFRCQCRSGRVLTIELSDEGFGDIQRFGGADDALNFGDIEDQRDAMALGIDIESLADVLIDWAQDLLELLIKGSLSIFAFTLIVFFICSILSFCCAVTLGSWSDAALFKSAVDFSICCCKVCSS